MGKPSKWRSPNMVGRTSFGPGVFELGCITAVVLICNTPYPNLLLGEIFDFAKYVASFVCMQKNVCEHSTGHIFRAISFKFGLNVGIWYGTETSYFGHDPYTNLDAGIF